MSGPEFFQTPMGLRFYQSTMPRIAKALESIANKLEAKEDNVDYKAKCEDMEAFMKRVGVGDLQDKVEKLEAALDLALTDVNSEMTTARQELDRIYGNEWKA